MKANCGVKIISGVFLTVDLTDPNSGHPIIAGLDDIKTEDLVPYGEIDDLIEVRYESEILGTW